MAFLVVFIYSVFLYSISWFMSFISLKILFIGFEKEKERRKTVGKIFYPITLTPFLISNFIILLFFIKVSEENINFLVSNIFINRIFIFLSLILISKTSLMMHRMMVFEKIYNWVYVKEKKKEVKYSDEEIKKMDKINITIFISLNIIAIIIFSILK